jgi:septal ring factor EnvC (AmiA/AmiB activator)
VLVELQRITLRASKSRAQAEIARLKQDQIQRELKDLTKRKTEINRELDQLKASLRTQVRWLQALGPLGTLSLFPSYSDIENYLVKNRYLEWRRNSENRKLREVLDLHTELVEREKEITKAEGQFKKIVAEASVLQEEFRANEKHLHEYLDGIQKDEQRKKGIQAELREETVLLERMLAALLSKDKPEGSYRAVIPFSSLMGKLQSPVEGNLAEGFGIQTHPRFGTKTMNAGLMIVAKPGASVQTVADGKVSMADSYQSYGLMVIIDHGSAYLSLYTHLRAISVSKDQLVKSGETIGYVGDTVDGPRLGFEIRHQTGPKTATPEDPQKWLISKYGAKKYSNPM